MNHRDILTQSANLLRARSEQHGTEEDVMNRACMIFESITGIEMSLYEGAIFLHSYEMARVKKNRSVTNVMNSIDYLALSAQFSTAESDALVEESTDGVKEMAAKLAPAMRPMIHAPAPQALKDDSK
jgi:hypothetical protein